MAYRAPELNDSQARRDAPRLAWVIDAVAGGSPPNDPRPKWNQTIRTLALKSPVQPKTGGSWNIPVLRMVDRAIMDDTDADWQRVADYCGNQLGGDSLWGQEILSAEYCWPPVALALCLEKARQRNRNAVASQLQSLLDAHALLMALCALPQRQNDPQLRTGFNFHVCAPGIRNEISFSVGVWRDFWLGCMLREPQDRPANLPPLYNNANHINWPARVSQVVRATVSPDLRATILEHIQHGSRVADIVGRLNGLGVSLQATLHIQRRQGGNGNAWFERDLAVPTKAPTMAESGIGGDYRILHAHPPGFNSNASRPKGQATCRLAGGVLHQRVTGFGPNREQLDASIPAATGATVYHLVIDRQGAREEGSPPPPIVDPPVDPPPIRPPADPPPAPPPAVPPGNAEDWQVKIDEAARRLGRAMPGLHREQALATARAVLRRIALEEDDRSAAGGSALQGARALVTQLRQLQTAGTTAVGSWQADIRHAGTLASAAGQGLRHQLPLATEGAVLQRIGFEEAGGSAPGGSALQGARTLVRLLQELQQLA